MPAATAFVVVAGVTIAIVSLAPLRSETWPSRVLLCRSGARHQLVSGLQISAGQLRVGVIGQPYMNLDRAQRFVWPQLPYYCQARVAPIVGFGSCMLFGRGTRLGGGSRSCCGRGRSKTVAAVEFLHF